MSDFNPSEYVTVPDGWSCKRLADCTVDGNISYGIVQPGQHNHAGIPVIRVNNVNNGQLDLSDVLKVSPEIEKKYERTRLEGGEVLLTLVGSTGQSFVAPQELEGWNVPRAIAVIRTDNEVGAEWINICLQSKETKHFLNVRANTTVQKTLNLKDVRDIPILIPPKNVKESIEGMALSLSNKIELNRQTNQTLEQIAQAIFKSWFVDFEPTRAKIAAKQNYNSLSLRERVGVREKEYIERAAMAAISGAVQGCTNAASAGGAGAVKTFEELDQLSSEQQQQLRTTAALFPDALVDSELGEIPEGWVISPLGEFLDVLETGRRPKGGVSGITEGIPSVGAENIIRIGQYNFGKEKFVSSGFFEKITSGVVESEDVLLYKDGGKPGIFKPRVSMFGHGFPYEKFAINEHVFRMRSNKLGQPYLYLQISHENVLFDLRHKGGKAAIPGINQKDVRTVDILIPPASLLNNFNNSIHQIMVGILNSAKQSLALSELRDALLPKLLSGEIELNSNQNMEVVANGR